MKAQGYVVNDALPTIAEALRAERHGIEPILVGDAAVARLLGISRAGLWRLISRGLFGPKRIRLGRRVLWSADEIRAWASAGCPKADAWASMRRDE